MQGSGTRLQLGSRDLHLIQSLGKEDIERYYHQ